MINIDELRDTIAQMPGTHARLLNVQKILPHAHGTEELHNLITYLLANPFSPPCWVSIAEQAAAHTVVLATIMASDELPNLHEKIGLGDAEAREGLLHLSKNGYMSRIFNITLFAATYVTMVRHATRHGFTPSASSPEVTELEDLL